MPNDKNLLLKSFRYLCLTFILFTGLIAVIASGGGNGDDNNGSDNGNTTTTDSETNGDTGITGHVEPDMILDGTGQNIDSLAIWTAPDLEESLLLITGKANNMVEIWQYPFDTELNPLPMSAEVNGIAVDQTSDLLYLTLSGSREVKVYSLPELTSIGTFGLGIIGAGENNLTLFQPSDGSTTIYVTDTHNVYYFDEAYDLLGQFAPPEIYSMETIVADNFHEIIYIPEELGMRGNEGVYAYSPGGTPFEKNGTNRFGFGHFGGDEEGIIIYCRLDASGIDTGAGYIVVADQMSDITEFEFFDRETWEHVGVLTIGTVSNTDGITSSQVSYPDYPMGIFAAVDNDSKTVVVGWDVILDAMNLEGSFLMPMSFGQVLPSYLNDLKLLM